MLALIWCPFPSAESAKIAAHTLLEEKLVACANIGAPMQSVFLYQGQIEESTEVGVIFKTCQMLLDRATMRLEVLHPYETPAIAAWSADESTRATHDWIASELKG